MANPWRAKVLAFNKQRAADGEKASDMGIVIRKLGELPPGQLKKLFTDEELVSVLNKYGVIIDADTN